MRKILCLIAALAIPLTMGAQPRHGSTTAPSSGGTTWSLELEIISPEQIKAYQQGTAPSEITLKTGETLEEFLYPRGAPPNFELPWTAITCGGAISEGGGFQFESLCGPSLSGTSSGGPFSAGPITGDEGIFADGFESGNTDAWAQ